MLSRSAVEDACAYFDTWLAFRVRCDRIPGIQAAVLHDGDVVWTGAHGLADVAAGTALTPAHRFRIASHSKTFTATAVVRLADEGALRLDDTVGRWVPEVAAGPIGRVTLRELLGHGGGVARDGADADFWCLGFPFPDRGDLLGFAADPAAGVLARNERFKYSNVGFSLLGAVVEAATGSSYADHVTDVLLRPLGLDATTPDIDPAAAGDHATGYTGLGTLAERLPIDHVATGAMAAATGFSSTATDVVRWFGAHFFGDDRILSDDAKRLMQHTQWSVAGAGEYALGLDVADLGGRRVLGHGGGFPGFITQTWFDPVDRLAVAVFTNVIDGPAYASRVARGAPRRSRRGRRRRHRRHRHGRRRPAAVLTAVHRALLDALGHVRHRRTRWSPRRDRPGAGRPAPGVAALRGRRRRHPAHRRGLRLRGARRAGALRARRRGCRRQRARPAAVCGPARGRVPGRDVAGRPRVELPADGRTAGRTMLAGYGRDLDAPRTGTVPASAGRGGPAPWRPRWWPSSEP